MILIHTIPCKLTLNKKKLGISFLFAFRKKNNNKTPVVLEEEKSQKRMMKKHVSN